MADIVFSVIDPRGIKIICNDERLKYIQDGHPEIHSSELLKTTVENPCYITEDRYDEDINVYLKTDCFTSGSFRNMTLKAVVNIEKSFIVTAHLTDKDQIGKVLWTKYTK